MAQDLSPDKFLYALIGGILPALFWLWFWLKEDKKRPEPRKVLLITFLAGMIMVIFALLIEEIISNVVKNIIIVLFLWASVEEILKYIAARYTAFRTS